MDPDREQSLEATVVCGDSDDEQMEIKMEIQTEHRLNDVPHFNPAISLQETLALTDEDEQETKDDIIKKQQQRIRQLENEGRSKDAKIKFLQFQVAQNNEKDMRIAELKKEVADLKGHGTYFPVKIRPKDKPRRNYALDNKNQQARAQRSRQRSHSQPHQHHHVPSQSQQRAPLQFQVHNSQQQQPHRQQHHQQHRQQPRSPPNTIPRQQKPKRGVKGKKRVKAPYNINDQVCVKVDNRWNKNKWMGARVYWNYSGHTHVEFLSHLIKQIKKEDEQEKPLKEIYLREKIPYGNEEIIKPAGSMIVSAPPIVLDYR